MKKKQKRIIYGLILAIVVVLIGWSIYKEQAFEKRIQGYLDTFPTIAEVEEVFGGSGFEIRSSILKNADQNANIGFVTYYGDSEVNEMFMIASYVFIEGKSELMSGNPYVYIQQINNNELTPFYSSPNVNVYEIKIEDFKILFSEHSFEDVKVYTELSYQNTYEFNEDNLAKACQQIEKYISLLN